MKISVVIPCFNVSRHILQLLTTIGPEVSRIYVVDDDCPEDSGGLVARECRDPRVIVLKNPENLGVGGAVMAGYRHAIADGMDIIVKLDGDGQMDARDLASLVAPIVAGDADYTKGNRFFDLSHIYRMPTARIIGNAALSFMTKISSGYWDIFDPTNGYTAISSRVARRLPMEKISQRYFFESDILFRLGTLRAVVVDVPIESRYADESSGLRISGIIIEFARKHCRNLCKRIFYNYFLRDMSLASFELLLGMPLLLFGIVFGATKWSHVMHSGMATPAGTVMLAALPIIVGLNFMLAFLAYDIANVPKRPLSRLARN